MGTRLLLGFSGVIMLTILVGCIGVNRMGVLSDITEKMYRHPMAVSNVVRDIKMDIIAMDSSMKDVVMAKTRRQIESAIKSVDQYEEGVLSIFLYLKSVF